MFVRPTQLVQLDEAGNPIEEVTSPEEKPRSRLSRLVAFNYILKKKKKQIVLS